MAVLKSPRNSRKKGKWALAYSASIQPTIQSLHEHKTPRSKHKFHSFLRASTHWVSTADHSSQSQFWLPEFVEGVKPPVNVKYGRRTFDSSRPNPLIFRAYFRSKTSSQRLNTLVNADHLVFGQRPSTEVK